MKAVKLVADSLPPYSQQSLLEKEHSLQEQVDELRTNLASLEQSRTIKEKTVSDSKKEISRIGKELAAIGSGGAALDSVEQELRSAVSAYCVYVWKQAREERNVILEKNSRIQPGFELGTF